MASEYIKYLTKDEKPAEPPPPLSPRERRKNWLYYHKWHLIIGAVFLLVLLDLGRSVLHIGEIQPDVQVAYIGQHILPDDVLDILTEELSRYCPDANGDGRQVVEIHSYIQVASADSTDLSSIMVNDAGGFALNTASFVQLTADLDSRFSFLFLLEDPVGFESEVRILAYPDGSLPSEDTDPQSYVPDCTIPWIDCAGLAASTRPGGALADADSSVRLFLESLSAARRGFWTEKTCRNPEGCEQFWENLQSGTPAQQ